MSAHSTKHGYSMPQDVAQALQTRVETLPGIKVRLEPSKKGNGYRLHLQYVGRWLYVNSERDLDSILLAWSQF